MATKTFTPSYPAPNAARMPSYSWRKDSWKLLALPLLLFIAVPLIAIFVCTASTNFFANLNQTQVIQTISLSIVTSLTTTGLTLIAGTPVAYWLFSAKSQRHASRRVVSAGIFNHGLQL